LLLFGQQHAFDLSSRAGKETLQAKALAEIQRVLKEETGSPGIEAVYFSSFVIQ
jgi:flagellar FliL protein